MNSKTYQFVRKAVAFFVGLLLAIAVTKDNVQLAVASIVTGMVFILLVRVQATIKPDERDHSIQEKAAYVTYAIFAPTIGITALLLLLPSKAGIPLFNKGEWLYLESLGMIFAYLTLFIITVYALSHHFLDRRYGGGSDEE